MSLRVVSAALAGIATDPIPGAPPARATIRPADREELAEVLAACSADGLTVLVWGHGTRQGIGHRVEPDIVLSTERLDRFVDHQPEDLTLTVEAGVTVGAIAARLRPLRQFAILPETVPASSVGGVVATGVSGYRRLRLGPTRDHLLEVTIATGDGRLVRAGARVVKHVQGYDLMRLVAGSLGSLGVVVEVCLKLWPMPPAAMTVGVDDPATALRAAHRPLAVLQDRIGAYVYLAGTTAELEAQALALAGEPESGHRWPLAPDPDPDEGVWSIRVPSTATAEAVARLPDSSRFVAEHGVGIVTATLDGDEATVLRAWAEGLGGAVVLLSGPAALYDDPGPWGADPPALALQRRVVARFDPDRIVNPGRPAGGI